MTPSTQSSIKTQSAKTHIPLASLSPAAAKLFLILMLHMDRARATVSLPVGRLASISGFSVRWCHHLLLELTHSGFLQPLPRKYHGPFNAQLTFPWTSSQAASARGTPTAHPP